MSKAANQTFYRIDHEGNLNRNIYPVWFFTNERIGPFFRELEREVQLEKVFAIGGAGDFAFSLLSSPALNKIDEVDVCDRRNGAGISINLKSGIFKNMKYREAVNLFLEDKPLSEKMYGKIKESMSPRGGEIVGQIVESCSTHNFAKCLKKSGLWYRYSFWQAKHKHRGKYLPYLASEERYGLLQESLDKLKFHLGDFNEILKTFDDGSLDLIYSSNIFDSKKYCKEPKIYLTTIKDKLKKNGLLLITTQGSPRKIIELVRSHGFGVYKSEIHKFNVFSVFSRHYPYSFLLFKKH